MIERYTLPLMGAIWSDKNKFDTWLKVEILACQAQAKLGVIPEEDLCVIEEKAAYEIDEIAEIEAKVHHDVIAFLTSVANHVGPSSRYIHLGMTSSDILDTTTAVCLKQSAELLETKLDHLIQEVAIQAKANKYTLQIGRSHGVHAEPTTFGLKMALMYDELKRCKKRLMAAKETVSYGQISGAVGTFAHIDPSVEEHVCQSLELTPAPVSTQILQRDRHAEYLTTLAVIAGTLDKYATEVRSYQRTELLEAEEGFRAKQKGSSAMPHKRNPIRSERICGLARVMRGNALVGLENIALWHERDITHSSAERVVLADSSIMLDYMLKLMIDVISTLIVYPENMKKNLEKTGGLIFSQRVLLELAKKGVTREAAYEIVQRNAMAAWEGKKDFKAGLLDDKDAMAQLSREEIDECFDMSNHTRHVDTIFKRVGLDG